MWNQKDGAFFFNNHMIHYVETFYVLLLSITFMC